MEGKEEKNKKNLIHFKCEETEVQKKVRQLSPKLPTWSAKVPEQAAAQFLVQCFFHYSKQRPRQNVLGEEGRRLTGGKA